MPLPVLPSKLVWERVRVEFDFSDQLEFNETITSWDVEVFVNSGTDPVPDDMIATRRFQDGPRLSQWIIGGVPGNIYRLVNTAVGSTGKLYKLERVIAVLPCEYVYPPLFGVMYTTTIYNLECIESTVVAGATLSGYVLESVLEELDIFGVVVSGQLRTPLISYEALPEGVNISGIISSGALNTPLVTYIIPFEGVDVGGLVITGSLRVILIAYNNYPPEGVDLSAIITGGALT